MQHKSHFLRLLRQQSLLLTLLICSTLVLFLTVGGASVALYYWASGDLAFFTP